MERDFTNAKLNRLGMYGGANGSKISIDYKGETYMLKFPPKPIQNREKSYTNSCISEYVSCHIFETLGIDTQKTLLGRYGNKVTVACKDFTGDGFELKAFAQLKNTIIDSEQSGYGTELYDILRTIEEQQIVSPIELKEFFWNMFIGDTLLGNFDRHNGNWGLLVNYNTGEVKIAPVFDCGSCLYPQADDSIMKWILGNREQIDRRIYEFPTSAIHYNGKKINYIQFLIKTDNEECLKALKVIGNRIDLPRINSIIENTPYISDIHKLFLQTMIKERKEKIIDRALERVGKSVL